MGKLTALLSYSGSGSGRGSDCGSGAKCGRTMGFCGRVGHGKFAFPFCGDRRGHRERGSENGELRQRIAAKGFPGSDFDLPGT